MELWKEFERRIVEDSQFQGVYVAKIPNEAVKVQNTFFRRKTPFDFAAGVNGRALFFDAKSTLDPKIYISDFITVKKSLHQLQELTLAHDRGNLAGYLIWLQATRIYVWLPISALQALMDLKVKTIDGDTPGVTVQSDGVPINLVKLTGV